MTDMSRATYVRLPADKPIGLDMKQFEQVDPMAAVMGNSQNKRDLEIINELMEQHNTLVGVLSRRLSSVKVI